MSRPDLKLKNDLLQGEATRDLFAQGKGWQSKEGSEPRRGVQKGLGLSRGGGILRAQKSSSGTFLNEGWGKSHFRRLGRKKRKESRN